MKQRPQIAWQEWGSPEAPPVVLLHASGCHRGWWQWVAPYISEQFRVIAPDLRGHGESDWADAYGFADYAGDIVDLADRLGLARFALMGHSLGGYVALHLAAERPARVTALVIADMKLEATPGEMAVLAEAATRPGRVFRTPDEAVAQYRLAPPQHRVPPERLRAVAQQNLRPLPEGGWTYAFDRRSLAHEPLAPLDLAARLACPTLVMRGQHSTIMPWEEAEALARTAGGQYVEVADTYHHLILEEPEAVAAIALPFLQQYGR